MRWVVLILLAASLADAAPQVELRARSQLVLQRVKTLSDGEVEVIGQLVDKLSGDAIPAMAGS